MSRKRNCWDNVVSESSFHTLETALTHHMKFKIREEVKPLIFECTEVFYNRKRVYGSNDYLSPAGYENKLIG